MKSKALIALFVAVVLVYGVGYEGIWNWMICRIYVPEGHSLMVMFKGNLLWPNPPMAKGDFAAVDEEGDPVERGFLRETVGPGRHFKFDPIHYRRILVPDVLINPGEVGVVTCKLGEALPPGEFLVDGDVGNTKQRGILRKVIKPGRFRINLYGYDVAVVDDDANIVRSYTFKEAEAGTIKAPKTPDQAAHEQEKQHTNLTGKKSGWVDIPPGYVGVVTNLTAVADRGEKAGVQNNVLQPGVYAVNPRGQQIDIVEIGYREISMTADLDFDPRTKALKLDPNGEPMLKPGGDPGINFPSNDGFPISLDFTGVWGIMPDQAPKVVELFGNISEVQETVIEPEINSICRIHGSQLGAVDLLTGESREAFQQSVSDDFREVLKEKSISLQVGLVRHIYIPSEVRGPIQKANIADEEKLTRDEESETQKVMADLGQAEANIEKERNRVKAETEKVYQEALALGSKEVESINAATERLVAAIAKETAEIEAKTTVVLGEAEAEADKLKQEATAQKFELAVSAFGAPEAYNQWVFANALPEDMKLMLIYAGEGTFWTDLKGFQETALGKMMQSEVKQKPGAKASPPTRKLPQRPGTSSTRTKRPSTRSQR